MILFTVTIVVAMLAAGSLALLSLLSTEYEATVLRGDEIQASQLVQSGVERIARAVESPENEPRPGTAEFADSFYFSGQGQAASGTADPFYDAPERFRGIEVAPAFWARPARGAGRFTVFSPRIEQGCLRGIRFGLVNESSRLHLGTVLDWEIESPGQGSRSLMKLPGMTPSIADSILDWLDADKTPRPSGAELDYYERTGVPYRPRNAVPVTLEELLLVRDTTRSLLFGTDKSFSYGAGMSDLRRAQGEIDIQTDLLFETRDTANGGPGEATATESATSAPPPAIPDGEPGAPTLPWCFLLTTLSAEKLVDPSGEAQTYLNGADLEFLEERLKRHLDEESVRFVLAWRRNNGPIEAPIDLLDAVVTDKDSSAELKSPFSFENTGGEDRFLKLLDYATCSPSVVLTGRINVNEAPRLVLEAVPELTPATVASILNRRDRPESRRQGRFRHPTWLLAEKIVDRDTMKKLSKRLTTGGDVYRAQVVGFFDGTGTASRAEIVVDATVKPPRPVFSKDLTMFGSGFE